MMREKKKKTSNNYKPLNTEIKNDVCPFHADEDTKRRKGKKVNSSPHQEKSST